MLLGILTLGIAKMLEKANESAARHAPGAWHLASAFLKVFNLLGSDIPTKLLRSTFHVLQLEWLVLLGPSLKSSNKDYIPLLRENKISE